METKKARSKYAGLFVLMLVLICLAVGCGGDKGKDKTTEGKNKTEVVTTEPTKPLATQTPMATPTAVIEIEPKSIRVEATKKISGNGTLALEYTCRQTIGSKDKEFNYYEDGRCAKTERNSDNKVQTVFYDKSGNILRQEWYEKGVLTNLYEYTYFNDLLVGETRTSDGVVTVEIESTFDEYGQLLETRDYGYEEMRWKRYLYDDEGLLIRYSCFMELGDEDGILMKATTDYTYEFKEGLLVRHGVLESEGNLLTEKEDVYYDSSTGEIAKRVTQTNDNAPCYEYYHNKELVKVVCDDGFVCFEKTLDEANRPLRFIQHGYNTDNHLESEWKYDEAGHLLAEYSYQYQDIDGNKERVLTLRTDYLYDEDGNLLQTVDVSVDEETGEERDVSFTMYYYESVG